jgi:hypothetical protein
MSTANPIDQIIGSVLTQVQLDEAGAGTWAGVIPIGCETGGAEATSISDSDGCWTSKRARGGSIAGNSITASLGLKSTGVLIFSATAIDGLGEFIQAGSTCHCGNMADKTGTASIATIANIQTKCLVAAESRLRIKAATAAKASSTVPLIAESNSSRLEALNTPATANIVRFMLSALLLGLFDQCDQTLTFIIRHLVLA